MRVVASRMCFGLGRQLASPVSTSVGSLSPGASEGT